MPRLNCKRSLVELRSETSERAITLRDSIDDGLKAGREIWDEICVIYESFIAKNVDVINDIAVNSDDFLLCTYAVIGLEIESKLEV